MCPGLQIFLFSWTTSLRFQNVNMVNSLNFGLTVQLNGKIKQSHSWVILGCNQVDYGLEAFLVGFGAYKVEMQMLVYTALHGVYSLADQSTLVFNIHMP